MATTVTTLGDLLKQVYSPGSITTLQNLESPLRSFIGDATDYTLGGKGFFFPVSASGDEGYGYIDSNAALPTPQNEQVLQAEVDPVVFAGAYRITGLARAISSRDSMSFANGLQFAIDKKLRRMTVYAEGTCFRDGKGRLALTAGAPGADTTTTGFQIDNTSAGWIRRNMIVDFRDDSANTFEFQNIKITEVDYVGTSGNPTLKTDIDVDTASDNIGIYLSGTQPGGTAARVNREPFGFDAAIQTTVDYLGIDISETPEWEGNVITATGNDLDEDRLLQAETRILVVGGVPDNEIGDMRIVAHPNQRRKYFAVVVPQKQFTGLNLDAGYRKLTWNGHEFVCTYTCPEDTVYMGNFGEFQRFTAPGGQMQIDTTFGPAIKWAQGFDSGIGYIREYCNTAIRKPNAWCKITALNNVTNR